MRPFPALIPFVLVACVSAQGVPEPDPGALLNQAQAALDQGDSSKGLELLDNLLAFCRRTGEKSGEANMLYRIGRVRYRLGEMDKATECFEQALAIVRAEGQKGPEATVLNALGLAWESMGEKAKAMGCYEQALPISVALGDKKGEASTLNNLGLLYQGLGETPKALGLYQQALAIHRAMGDQHGEATTLCNLGNAHHDLGDNAKAVDCGEQALSLMRALGDKGGEASALNNLGMAHDTLGEKAKALECYEQALALSRACGDRNAEGAELCNLGKVHSDLAEKAKALECYEKALAIARAVQDRAGESTILGNIGVVYDGQGEEAKALTCHDQALAIHRALGDKIGEAKDLNNLGSVYNNLGQNAKALECYGQALPLQRAAGARTDEGVTLDNIGRVYDALGEKGKALDYFEQALPVHRAVGNRGAEARTLNNMGSVYDNLGQAAKALGYYEQALALDLAVGDKVSEGATLDNLGKVYAGQGGTEKAASCFEQALALHRTAGDRSGEAVTLTNLGNLYADLGQGAKALVYCEQALPLQRAAGHRAGEATTLNTIGTIHGDLGEPAQALGYYEQALPLMRAVGNRHGEAVAMENQALILPVLKRANESTAIFRQITQLQEQLREWAFPSLSEAQKVMYARSFEATQAHFLSHTAAYRKDDPASVQACFDAWLGFKGSVMEAQGRLQDAILASRDPQVREQAGALQETRTLLARLYLNRPEGLSPEAYEQELKRLRDRKENLEASLAKQNQSFALEREARRVDGARLAALLPKDSAYLDFARIPWFDFEAQQVREPRYLVFVFLPGDKEAIHLLDLGPAEPIDRAVQTFQSRIQAAKPVAEALDPLYQALVRPLEPLLAGRRQILASPDGPLHLVPFEVLGPKGGQSLMDRFTLSYLGSGQDVARFALAPTASGQVVILANPDFDLEAGPGKGPGGTRSMDIGSIHFGPLPGTHQEAEAIAPLFSAREILRLEGPEAQENRLRNVEAPRILHLATHGYFLGHQQTAAPEAGRGVKVLGLGEPRPDPALENPMVRSGIALAGANASIRTGDDAGLVCAEKLMGMNLAGTDLVVLSACNTGLGRIQDGEGVFGLKRAFILAGARTLVVSLWPVPDQETKDLMVAFYQGLLAGKPKVRALADAKQSVAMLKPDPYYWAAFVLVGNPR